VAPAAALRSSRLCSRFDDEKLARLARPFSEVGIPAANQMLVEPRTMGSGPFVI
jgi:hypothetical protein